MKENGYRLNARIDINRNLTDEDYLCRLNEISEILDMIIDSDDMSEELEILNKNFDNKYTTTIPSYINELHLKLNEKDFNKIQKRLRNDKGKIMRTFESIGLSVDKIIDVDIFSDYKTMKDESVVCLLITTNLGVDVVGTLVDYVCNVYRDNIEFEKKCLYIYSESGADNIYIYNQYAVIFAHLLTKFLQ